MSKWSVMLKIDVEGSSADAADVVARVCQHVDELSSWRDITVTQAGIEWTAEHADALDATPDIDAGQGADSSEDPF